MKASIISWNNSWLNKYTITALIFLVWMAFLDDKYNLLKQHKLSNKVENLQLQKEQLELDLKEAIVEYEELHKNQEKYAREKYFISKEGEDVFIIDSK